LGAEKRKKRRGNAVGILGKGKRLKLEKKLVRRCM
jgi:hypothetical protein